MNGNDACSCLYRGFEVEVNWLVWSKVWQLLRLALFYIHEPRELAALCHDDRAMNTLTVLLLLMLFMFGSFLRLSYNQ